MTKKILIIHGWGKGQESWQKVKEALEKNGFEVIVPDLPGFGKNPPPDKIWGVREYALWLDDLIKEKVILFGHSFGGAVALNFLNISPQKVEKIILCSPAIFRKKRAKVRFFSFLAEKFRKIVKRPLPKIVERIIAKILGNQDYYQSQGIKREIFKKIIEEDCAFLLEKVNLPTLIIWGKEDKVVPLEEGEKLKKLIKNSKLVVLEKAGHSPHLEKANELSRVVIDFLEGKHLPCFNKEE